METKVKVVDRGKRYLVLRWIDPETGADRQKTSGTADRSQAKKLAAQLEADLNEGRYVTPSKVTWEEFRDRFEAEKLPSLAVRTAGSYATALNHVENLMRPERLADLTAAALSTFQARLRKREIKETSIATHLRHVKAALGWANSMGLLAKRPEIQLPKRARGSNHMRGRPITAEEFERMLAAVPQVRSDDARAWIFYMKGLWLSGLRLGESLLLAWDEDTPISIDLNGRFPRLRILAEADKGFRDRLLPITPDFTEFVLSTPAEQRIGRIFKLPSLTHDEPLSSKHVGRVISEIGKRAGVIVNKKDRKFASSHDLRRAFGTRWAPRVKPATLQLITRHESIETTLKYYVAQSADEVADELWKSRKSGMPGEAAQQVWEVRNIDNYVEGQLKNR